MLRIYARVILIAGIDGIGAVIPANLKHLARKRK
jgi:hypothetical protein